MSMKIIVLLTTLLLICSSQVIGQALEISEAKIWREGEALFKQDSRWLGADGAISYPLSENRILWLFGDTFVAEKEKVGRRKSVFVRNTIAIQEGANPAKAKIDFYWKHKNGLPSSFFPEDGDVWHWPGGVVRIKDRLFIFLMAVKPTKGDVFGFGFEAFESRVVLVDNPGSPPNQWNLNEVATLHNDLKVIVGSSSVLVEKGHIYAFGSKEDEDHDIYLVRWKLEDFYEAVLSDEEWWCGDEQGFKTLNSKAAAPRSVIEKGQTEFTVHYDEKAKCYIQAQGTGFGVVPLALRVSSSLVGPWSDLVEVFEPEEKGRKNLLLYAVKSHPELTGADLVLSYVTNSTDAEVVFKDNSVYYPRLVKINFAASTRENGRK